MCSFVRQHEGSGRRRNGPLELRARPNLQTDRQPSSCSIGNQRSRWFAAKFSFGKPSSFRSFLAFSWKNLFFFAWICLGLSRNCGPKCLFRGLLGDVNHLLLGELLGSSRLGSRSAGGKRRKAIGHRPWRLAGWRSSSCPWEKRWRLPITPRWSPLTSSWRLSAGASWSGTFSRRGAGWMSPLPPSSSWVPLYPDLPFVKIELFFSFRLELFG